MSNQEQQFYSSEQQPPSSQQSYQYYQSTSNVNTDPREQQQELYGGPEYYVSRGEKLQPHPPRRKGFRLLWFLPLVLLLIGGLSYGLSGSHDQPYNQPYKHFQSSDDAQIFPVNKAPTLVIHDNAGTVHIHSDGDSSKGNTITVRIDRSGRPASNQLLNFDKVNDVLTVDTTPSQDSNDNNVDIDITTPQASDVKVIDDNGDVHVEQITGNVTVQTAKGDIDAHSVSGQVTLSSTNGDVSLDNGSLSGQSSLHSDNGNIHYNGSINPQGSYKFDTINGSVDVRLPGDTAFHLETHSTSDFNNEFGGNDVGNGTRPSLTISSENGSIRLSKD